MLNTHEPHRAVVSSIYITNNTTCSTGSELISNGEIIFQLASQIFVSCWLYDHIYMYYSHNVVIRMSNAGIHCYQLRKPCFPAMNFYCYITTVNVCPQRSSVSFSAVLNIRVFPTVKPWILMTAMFVHGLFLVGISHHWLQITIKLKMCC